MKKFGALVLAVAMTAMTLCACGAQTTAPAATDNTTNTTTDNTNTTTDNATSGKTTLGSFYNTPDKKAAMDKAIDPSREQLASMYSSITLDFVDNSIIYTYTFQEGIVDPSQFSADEAALESMAGTVASACAQEAGVTDTITVTFTYVDFDGTVLGSYSFDN
ncbi:MAG: hypothetical protein KBS85_04430 [Lachnospiraceae bacterium]|nr:hypothetical protein [Candidatus Merdinaster equi]